MRFYKPVVGNILLVILFAMFGTASASDVATKTETLSGTVVRIDGSSIKLKVPEGRTGSRQVDVATDEKTEVMIDGGKGKVSDLKPGQIINVAPLTGVATKIEVRPSPK